MSNNMNIDISIFNSQELLTAASNFFLQLGIKLNSNTAKSLPAKELLAEKYREEFNCIKELYFAGIVDKSVFETTLSDKKYTIDDAKSIGDNAKNYEGLTIFALLLDRHPTRTQIANLSRAFNMKLKAVPTALLLKYDNFISLALPERFLYKQTWREGEKVGKVIILRDINIEIPHAGHTRILQDLANHNAKNYNELHDAWLKVLDVNILNKQFFQEISNWYFWAIENVQFPDDKDKNIETRNATNLIRLITRIIFVWFIKEKQLVPETLFDPVALKKIVKDFNKNDKSINYYNAILQNLFFATLNQKMSDRKFAEDGNFAVNRNEYGIKTHYRYDKLFVIEKAEAQKLFKQIPFLNGGLFDCLDKTNPETNKVEYVDGFSRNSNKRAIIPDFLFFGEEQTIDLNSVYDTRGRNYHVKGLFNILKSYKFTVTENTPIEEEIALDPELLGKVFENLLASYNPETQITARKQTGSFYTPREIVEYMVDESLIAYLKNYLSATQKTWADKEQELEDKLRLLLSYNLSHPFDETDTATIIQAINNCNILDPACGSGAFPMGILHKMVLMLQKLDHENKKWKEQQRERIIGEKILELQNDKKIAAQLSDAQVRERAMNAVNDRLQELDKIFNSEYNFDDYSRKLFLIENCIFGIDIQSIAVQIAKLRFFISLVIDQKKSLDNDNENFGIRALPNLETKFVAANTLIGLNRPEQQTMGYQLVKELEEELREIRSQYFVANTRKEKLDLQDKDRELRNKIAQKLTEEGWDENIAKKIAMFDPYDQNASTDWFDPEWMFGVTDGFNIVLGNPPYVNVERIDKTIKDNISKFRTAYQKYDLYILFYEKAIDLLRPDGQLSYITSNKFLSQGYGLFLRKEFLKYHIHSVINFNYDVFESATVRTCIFNLQKSNFINENIRIIDIQTKKDEDKFVRLDYNFLDQNIFNETDENNFRINLTNRKIEILNKIKQNTIRVDNIFSVNYGLRPSSEKLGLKKESFIYCNNNDGNYKKYFEGKDMGKWTIKSYSFLNYQPTIMYNPMFSELFENKKLVGIRTLSDIEKLRFIYDEEDFYCNDSVVVLVLWYLLEHVKNQTVIRTITNEKIECSKKFNYFYVQGILNSRLIKFYVSELLYDGAHFYPNHIKSLPIKNISPSQQQPIISLVSQILFLKDPKHSAVSDMVSNEVISYTIEKVIDACVYELYFEDEIKATKTGILYLLEEFLKRIETMPVEQQINLLFAELNEYKSEIRNRIILQKIHSPSVAQIIKSTTL
jgi:hypothetical protein